MYDSSTANPFQPTGTAGGGNKIFASPIFNWGSASNSDSSSGSPGVASTSQAATAALGGPATSAGAGNAPAVAAAGASSLLSNPLVLIAAVAVAGIGFVVWLVNRK